MAGRPRTMAKRVKQLLERQEAVAAEMDALIPKQYRPTMTWEQWDPHADVAGCDWVTLAWRVAVSRVERGRRSLSQLSYILDQKVAQIERRAAMATAAEADGEPDKDDDPERVGSE